MSKKDLQVVKDEPETKEVQLTVDQRVIYNYYKKKNDAAQAEVVKHNTAFVEYINEAAGELQLSAPDEGHQWDFDPARLCFFQREVGAP